MPVITFNREVMLGDGDKSWLADCVSVKSVIQHPNELIVKHHTGVTQSFNINTLPGKELIKSITPDNGICVNGGL